MHLLVLQDQIVRSFLPIIVVDNKAAVAADLTVVDKVVETTVAAADKIEIVTHLLVEMRIKRSTKKQFKKKIRKQYHI